MEGILRFQNGLSLTIKELALTVHGLIFGWAYRIGRIFASESCGGGGGGGGLVFGRAYFFGRGGGLIIGILRYLLASAVHVASCK